MTFTRAAIADVILIDPIVCGDNLGIVDPFNLQLSVKDTMEPLVDAAYFDGIEMSIFEIPGTKP